jgi:exodeoxyribonuclease-1
LAEEEVIALTDVYFGRIYNFAVTHAGTNQNDRSDIGLFDLAFDPQHYTQMTEPELVAMMNSNQKAIRRVRANSQPILMPQAALPADLRGGRLDNIEYQRRARVVRNDRRFQERVSRALAMKAEDSQEPSPYIEEQTYEGLPERADENRMAEFHRSDWGGRVQLAWQFEDARFRELAERLIYFERPDLLDGVSRARMDAWVASRYFPNGEVPWLTVPKALQEVADLKRNADVTALAILNETEEHLNGLARVYG